MSRWWAVALLSLSVGLNLGLAVSVIERRFAAPPPAPVVVVPATGELAPASVGGSPAPVAAGQEAALSPAPASLSPQAPPASPAVREPEPRAEDPFPAGEEGLPPLEAEGEAVPDWIAEARPGEGGGPPTAPGRPRGGPSAARLEEMAARLGVPERDRPRFLALQRQFLEETHRHRFELDRVRLQLKAELLSDEPDRERLQGFVAASARVQAALEGAFVDHVLAARELLEGEAERRYLTLLSRLGPRWAGPGSLAGRPGERRLLPPGRGRRPGEGRLRWREGPPPPKKNPP